MKISILHLSDIHIKESINSIFDKVSKISDAIKSELYEINHLFVLFSGDIAYSGNDNEYIKAMEFVEILLKYFKEKLNINVFVLFAPGNHDCNFNSGNKKIRKILVDNIQENKVEELDSDLLEQICLPQVNYFEFTSLYEPKDNIVFQDKLMTEFLFDFKEYSITFRSLNTAWVSQLHEVPGTMVFPINLYEETLNSYNENLSITFFHHPFHWLNNINFRVNKEKIEQITDIIFTGHDHHSTFSKKDDFEGSSIEYIEGGVLQDSNNSNISEFNLVNINLETRQQKLNKFSWKENKYIPTFQSEWIDYNTNSKSTFQLNSEFESHLKEPGIDLTHPRKTKIMLNDIYIYPDARITKVKDESSQLNDIINLEELTEINSENKYLILGENNSGKSSFLRKIFQHYYKKDFVPVYLNGSFINKYEIEDFNKLLYKQYEAQYSSETLENFKQLDDEKKVIIIDDFDKMRLNNEYSFKLLKNLNTYYKNLFITGNELLKFIELLNKNDEVDNSLQNIMKLELMEFGHSLRYKLIEKWNSLGQVETISDEDLIIKNNNAENTINTIIGNNYVPSFPFFLLIMLQTIESGLPHNLKESSYGYYYELLITKSFMNINLKHDEIDAFYNYISELAYYYFDNNADEIITDNLKQFHRYYCEEYDKVYDFEKYKARLIEASILEETQGIFRFRYKYIFYYFVARYLSQKITIEEIRLIIKELAQKIYIEKYANILMFLTHLSKDSFIIEEIINQAKTIFNGILPSRLENEIDNLNSLIIDIPKLVYRDTDVKEYKEDELRIRDEIERTEKESAPASDTITNYNELDTFSKLNMAFKTLELIGQILKSYHGSIKGKEKYIYCEEAYSLGLRALNSFLSMIVEHTDALIKEIENIISKKGITKEEEKEKVARKFVFNLSTIVSFHFIKKISNSIGTYNLLETYAKVLNNNPAVAVKLIDISIKLDHLRSLPYIDIKNLQDEIYKNNKMSYSLLKALVINHLYKFKTDHRELQRICDLLNIPIKQQRSIKLKSGQKKE